MCGAAFRGSDMLLYILLVALCFFQAQCQCYLEDADATCAVCWKTANGVTAASACPAGIAITWDRPLPETLEEDTDYLVEYSLSIDTSLGLQLKPKVEKGNFYDVAHSNIHSCVKSRGACTPFVGDSPGLSTHTANTPRNFSREGSTYVNKFQTHVNLPVESYMVIAHTRVFVVPKNCPSCEDKYDIVVGIPRDVLPQPVAPSTDAYVSAAIAGVVIILLLGSVVWAGRTGRLDLELILLSLTREEVAFTSEIIISAGDMVAFTIGVKQDVIDSNEMQDIVPICIVFLVVGWFAAMVCVRKASKSLYGLIEAHFRPESHYGKKLTRRSVRDMVVSVRASSHAAAQMEECTRGVQEFASNQSFQAFGSFISKNTGALAVFQQYDRAKRQLHGQYINVLTMLLADLPMLVIGVYILAKADSTEFAVVIALVSSALLLGKKASDLGRFTIQTAELEQAREAVRDLLPKFNRFANSEVEKTSDVEKGLRAVASEPRDISKQGTEYDESTIANETTSDTNLSACSGHETDV